MRERLRQKPIMRARLGSATNDANDAGRGRAGDELDEDPRATPDRAGSATGLRQFVRDHRAPLLFLLFVAVAIAFVFAVLPQLVGFGRSLHRLRYGNKVWLAAAVGLECVSLFGYIALFRLIFSCEGVRIAWRTSYQITLAGTVATKLLAAGGAGGIALTVWALRAAGLSPRSVARRMTSFELLLYGVFMASLVVFGVGLGTGILPGHSRTGLSLFLAGFGGVLIVLVPALGVAADRAESWLRRTAQRVTRGRRALTRLATIPGTLKGGVQTTAEILRDPEPGLLGAIVYWAFDIATLWACFRAFGGSPPIAAVVLAYYVGQIANVLPIPGGIGGVEGGMIGAFIVFGVNGSTAVLAVLAYRLISFWLPILPGSVAYLRLRAAVSQWQDEDSPDGAGDDSVDGSAPDAAPHPA